MLPIAIEIKMIKTDIKKSAKSARGKIARKVAKPQSFFSHRLLRLKGF